jgi:uncharacterized membrane protein SpoIIM required for sporulation
MTQEDFKRHYQNEWDRLESTLSALDGGRKVRLVSAADVTDLAEFDRQYRRVCKHLALARQRRYGGDLVNYLNDLALRAHHHFYQRRRPVAEAVARFVMGGFSRRVRAHAGAVLVSVALFVVPALSIMVALRANPELVYSVMEPEQIRQIEEMYEPGADYRSSERAADSDLMMFGFYTMNNVSIGFRTFAGGIFFGIGSILLVIFNGLFLGATAGHLASIGYGETFFPFVVGHSAPELTALVLSCAAGLNLGWSLIAPGRRTRAAALKHAALQSVTLIYGVAGLLLMAAFIEAFWSARTSVPDGVKYAVGSALWAATLAYLLFAGKRREP